jgi:hypothetical protein
MLDPKLGKPYWEKRHQEKIIVEGKEYIDVFQSLEWIYFGQRAMSVQADDGQMKSRRIVSVSELADERSYLSSVFGLSWC